MRKLVIAKLQSNSNSPNDQLRNELIQRIDCSWTQRLVPSSISYCICTAELNGRSCAGATLQGSYWPSSDRAACLEITSPHCLPF